MMTYLLLISCLALAGFNTYMLMKRRKPMPKEEPAKPATAPAATVIKQLLPQLNCGFKVREVRDTEEILDFDYQGGHFNVAASTQNEIFKLGFMFFFSAPLEELEKVRVACNQLNMNTRMTRFTYSNHADQNLVFVHLFTSSVLVESMPDLKVFWKSLLESSFEHKRIFLRQFDTLKDFKSEEKEIEADRALFLLREHEIAQQDYKGKVRLQPESPYSLSRFVSEVMDQPGADVYKLQITTQRLETISNSEDIKCYPLTEALINDAGETATFRQSHAELMLWMKLPNGNQQTAFIMLQAEKETSKSLYFRATYCIPQQSISDVNSMTSHSCGTETYSVLMAYDKMDNTEEILKLNKEWEDAYKKFEQNKLSELSEEQKLLVAGTYLDNHYIVMKGHKAFMSKRYYEAIFYFEEVYNAMKLRYHEMGEAEKSAFFEIMFYLGFCYNDLGLYQKAYYYLDTIFRQNRIAYAKEFIVSLANEQDFRALGIINGILNRLEEIEEQEERQGESDKSSIKKFRNFLLHEKGFILMTIGEWEEAEKLFKNMLKDPENEAMALKELANLERYKRDMKEKG